MTINTLLATAVSVYGLLSIGAMFRAHKLADRIALLRRTLVIYGAVMVPFAASLVATASVRRPSSGDVRDGSVPLEWYQQLEDANREQLLGFLVLAFVVAVVAWQSLLVLGSLRSFVTEQSMDLATREQIADQHERAAS